MKRVKSNLESSKIKSCTILIVNGGKDPKKGKWIKLCVNKIIENTILKNYKIFIWNNNVEDEEIVEYLVGLKNIILVQANPKEKLSHPHQVPLQRLYEIANKLYNIDHVVVMDSDACPIRKGWLKELLGRLNENTVLSGVWRDELKNAISPYIHPSCFCTTTAFIEKYDLRLDYKPDNTENKIYDTLSYFTEVAFENGFEVYKLKRSNSNDFHRLLGGIYGNIVYHHGAGSRNNISFWDEKAETNLMNYNNKLNQVSSDLLFSDFNGYINWLLGIGAKKDQVKYSNIFQNIEKEKNLLQGATSSKFSLREKTYSFLKSRLNFRKSHSATEGTTNDQINRRPSIQGELMQMPFDEDILQLDLEDPSLIEDVSFIGVGPPKCGTRWWQWLILQHPDVVPNRLIQLSTKPIVEPVYFQHFSYKGLTKNDEETYLKAFRRKNGKICGEFSSIYLNHPHCTEYIAKAAPGAKIIVILRNPIDRTISHINHLLLNRKNVLGISKEKSSLFMSFNIIPEAYFYSFYSRGVKELYKHFKRENILILQYEKCKKDPISEIVKTYHFLGIRENFIPFNFSEKINQQDYIIKRPKLEERKRIRDYFFEEVIELKEIVPEINLELWGDFL